MLFKDLQGSAVGIRLGLSSLSFNYAPRHEDVWGKWIYLGTKRR